MRSREKHQAADTAPQDRSVEPAPSEQFKEIADKVQAYMAEAMAMPNSDSDQEQNWIAGHMATFAYRLLEAREQEIKRAFLGGYHATWHRERGVYEFDPRMKPGDPEGAWRAFTEYCKNRSDNESLSDD